MNKVEWTAEEIERGLGCDEDCLPMAQRGQLAAHLAKCTRLYATWEKAIVMEPVGRNQKAAWAFQVLRELAEAIDDE